MSRNANIIWLIIFLGTIIFGLYTLWGYNWHQKQLQDLKQQNDSLQQNIDSLKKELIFPSPSPLVSPSVSATPSAIPAKEATFSSQIILIEE